MTDFRSHVNRVLSHSTRVFGEEATFYPKTGKVFKRRAIFDNEYHTVDPDTERLVSTNQPALGINLNDFPVVPGKGDEVLVRGVRFLIVEKQEDGQGGATLLLHRKSLNERIRDTKASEAED